MIALSFQYYSFPLCFLPLHKNYIGLFNSMLENFIFPLNFFSNSFNLFSTSKSLLQPDLDKTTAKKMQRVDENSLNIRRCTL